MNKINYQSIVSHYEDCFARHGDSHLGVDWPNEKDVLRRYSVMLDVVKERVAGTSVLDFGCGAAHFLPFLNTHFPEARYIGLDVSAVFVAFCQAKFQTEEFLQLDVLKEPERLPQFDYAVMNGVFTEKRALEFEEMFAYFKQLVKLVFTKAKVGIAFNVMSKAVDWERDDLFHLPLDLLSEFLTKELSRHFVIRNDYGLYEYTVYIYKEANYV